MANEAPKEPTMEEILASIRKIISDDDTPAPKPVPAGAAHLPKPPEPVNVNAPEVFTGMLDEDDDVETVFDVEDVFADEAMPEEPAGEQRFEKMIARARKESPATATSPPPVPMPPPRPPQAEPAAAAPVRPAAFRPAGGAVQITPSHSLPARDPRPAPQTEPAMSADTRTASSTSPLTEDQTADAAASQLSRLVSRIDVSSQNTLEGLVSEMLRPMIKDWLDANLPRIVEEKVEAEVQRISRMAR